LSFFNLRFSANLAENRTIMAKKIIDIDGYIGSGGYSAQYVKNALRDAKKDDVEVHINSLGGDVSHAIAIKDALQAHGNVTAIYSGMSASSATIISLGCKTIKMTKDSFYLVHKPMMYVDAWGALNEDELRQLIDKLDSQLESTQKVTLQIANMYSEKTGKTIKAVLDLMKKNSWISAKEAETWGFVDEITEPVKVTNYADDQKMVALLAGNDLPPLPRVDSGSGSPAAAEEDIAARINKAGDNLIDRLKNLFPNKPKSKKEMSKTNVLALLCAVMAVDAIEMTDDGVFLNKEQLDKIEAELKKLAAEKTTAVNDLATANSAKDKAIADLTTANTEKDTAVNALTAANTALDELHPTVKEAKTVAEKVEAVRKELAKKPGAAATGAQGNEDQKKKIDGADPVTDYVKTIV
jgi:ATP-dependent Clp protease, protease subunit